MFANHSQTVYELLRAQRRFAPEQLEGAWKEHLASGKGLAEVLVDLGLIDQPTLLGEIADALGCVHLADTPESVPAEAVALLAGSQARSYGVIPLRAGAASVELLAMDPFNRQVVDDLTFA